MTRERMKFEADGKPSKDSNFPSIPFGIGRGQERFYQWAVAGVFPQLVQSFLLFSFLLFVAILSEREQYDSRKCLSHTWWY